MKKIYKIQFKTFFLFVFVFLGVSCAFAEKITFSARHMYGSASANQERTILEGNAVIQTENLKIRAKQIELSGESYRYVDATGDVKGTSDDGFNFTCGKMRYDRKTGIVSLENSVELTDDANDVNGKAQLVEYDLNNEVAILQIDVNLKNKNSLCTGALAIYRKKQKLIELSGSPKIVRDGDVFKAQKILLDMTSEEITLDGKVQGSVSTD